MAETEKPNLNSRHLSIFVCSLLNVFPPELSGSRFNVADFHSVILQNGGMTLSLLERLVDQWIAEVKVTQVIG